MSANPPDTYTAVGLIAVLITTVWNGVFQGIAARKKTKQDAIDAKQAEIDRKKLEDIQRTAQATHLLSNSAMGAILDISAAKSKQIYILWKTIATLRNEPSDLNAIELAQTEWMLAVGAAGKHRGQQETVDASGKT